MLKTNENIFEMSLDQLNICDRVLQNEMDSIEEIRKQLGEFSGLDEEIIQLGKINFNIQDAEYNLKSMIKVLNFAQIKYATCEKEVQNSANVSYTAQSNKARLKKVEFKIPYSSVINWKKGK